MNRPLLLPHMPESTMFSVVKLFNYLHSITDTVRTYQFAPSAMKNYSYGVSFKIAYMADDTLQPRKTCFQTNGTNETVVTIQAVLPDLTGFKV